jgi:hypothetical protein
MLCLWRKCRNACYEKFKCMSYRAVSVFTHLTRPIHMFTDVTILWIVELIKTKPNNNYFIKPSKDNFPSSVRMFCNPCMSVSMNKTPEYISVTRAMQSNMFQTSADYNSDGVFTMRWRKIRSSYKKDSLNTIYWGKAHCMSNNDWR